MKKYILNEKGLIAYYNVFLVFLFSFSISLNFINMLTKENNNKKYDYYLIQINNLDSFQHLLFEELEKLGSVPKVVNIDGFNAVRFTLKDQDSSLYQCSLSFNYKIHTSMKFYNRSIYFTFNNGLIKLMKVETKISG